MSNTNTPGRDGRQALRCFAKGMTGPQVVREMYRDGFCKAEAMKGIAECQAAGLTPATGASLAELASVK